MAIGCTEPVASDAEPTAGVRRYKPYPAYKDSGVEWFGKVPKHWEVLQIGRIGNLRKCNGGTKADEVSEGIPCIRYGDLYTYYTCFISRVVRMSLLSGPPTTLQSSLETSSLRHQERRSTRSESQQSISSIHMLVVAAT